MAIANVHISMRIFMRLNPHLVCLFVLKQLLEINLEGQNSQHSSNISSSPGDSPIGVVDKAVWWERRRHGFDPWWGRCRFMLG